MTWGDLDLGFTEGDIGISMEELSVDVTAHQEGSNVIESIRTGKKPGFSVTMKEAIYAKLKEIILAGGATATATAEKGTITCLAGAALNNKSFKVYAALNATIHYFWFNVADGGADPMIAGATAHEVALDGDETAAEVAALVATAMELVADITSADAVGAVITYVLAVTGAASPPVDVDSGFTFTIVDEGIGALVGWGGTRDFAGMVADSKKFVFHPQQYASDVFTHDLAFWKAYPVIKEITHSGEKPKMVKVDFRIFPDLTRQKAVRLFVFGDHR